MFWKTAEKEEKEALEKNICTDKTLKTVLFFMPCLHWLFGPFQIKELKQFWKRSLYTNAIYDKLEELNPIIHYWVAFENFFSLFKWKLLIFI